MSEPPEDDSGSDWKLALPGTNGPGAAIGITKGLVGGHTGIVVSTEAKKKWLHLAWHYLLKFEDLDDADVRSKPLREVCPTLLPEDLELVGLYATMFGERYGSSGLPYGFAFTSELDPTGQVSFGTDCGLSCATMVLLIFKRANVDLLRLETWAPELLSESRKSDDQREQLRIVRRLKKDEAQLTQRLTSSGPDLALIERLSALKLHIARVEEEVGKPRYRAEEVAVSSGIDTIPCVFDTAACEGEKLLARVKELAHHTDKAS